MIIFLHIKLYDQPLMEDIVNPFLKKCPTIPNISKLSCVSPELFSGSQPMKRGRPRNLAGKVKFDNLSGLRTSSTKNVLAK